MRGMQPAVKKKEGKHGPISLSCSRPLGLAKDLPKFQRKRKEEKKYGVPGLPWPLAYSLEKGS